MSDWLIVVFFIVGVVGLLSLIARSRRFRAWSERRIAESQRSICESRASLLALADKLEAAAANPSLPDEMRERAAAMAAKARRRAAAIEGCEEVER